MKHKPWAVMLAAFLGGVAAAANQFKVPPVMPILLDELDLTKVAGGWLMSVFAVAMLLLSIPTALVLTRLGARRVGLVALGFSAGGSVLGALAPGMGLLIAGRVIEGVGLALMAVAAPALISQWFAPRKRGLPMGIWASFVPLSNVLMFNLAPLLARGFGWQAVWWFGALFALVALAVFGAVVASPPQSEAASPAGVPSGPRALVQPTAWLLALGFAVVSFCLIGYNTWVPTYVHETLRVDPVTASSLASLMFLAGSAANVTTGWVMNRTRKRYRCSSLLLWGRASCSPGASVWAALLPSLPTSCSWGSYRTFWRRRCSPWRPRAWSCRGWLGWAWAS